MKIFAVLRGFPGLGRVVSGLTLLETFKNKYKAEIKVYTYMQGLSALSKFGFKNAIVDEIDSNQITSLGLDPVGSVCSKLIDEILEYKPDIILIDGEPLLINLISLCYDKSKVISLLNPSDLFNDSLPYSTKKFFRYSFLNCSSAIVHGLDNYTKDLKLPNVHKINTILRNNIIELKNNEVKTDRDNKNITCILGGGSKSKNEVFVDSTISFGINILKTAKILKNYNFKIFCNDEFIYNNLIKFNKSKNCKVYKNLGSEYDLYYNTDLVICRAGRNTISEIMFLNKPCILFAAGNDYRSKEQNNNISTILKNHPYGYYSYKNHSPEELVDLVKKALSVKNIENNFSPGNQDAINIILDIYNKNTKNNKKFIER